MNIFQMYKILNYPVVYLYFKVGYRTKHKLEPKPVLGIHYKIGEEYKVDYINIKSQDSTKNVHEFIIDFLEKNPPPLLVNIIHIKWKRICGNTIVEKYSTSIGPEFFN